MAAIPMRLLLFFPVIIYTLRSNMCPILKQVVFYVDIKNIYIIILIYFSINILSVYFTENKNAIIFNKYHFFLINFLDNFSGLYTYGFVLYCNKLN